VGSAAEKADKADFKIPRNAPNRARPGRKLNQTKTASNARLNSSEALRRHGRENSGAIQVFRGYKSPKPLGKPWEFEFFVRKIVFKVREA
jgi:hypothetical protein